MKNVRKVLSFACVLTIIASSSATTLFSDDFSDTSTAEKVKWNTDYTPSGFSVTYSNGAITLKNADTVYTAFYIHPFASKPATFTLSATFTIADTSVNGAGLMYCLNSSSGIKGYTLQLGTSQYLFCIKYTGSASPVLKSQFSPFVKQLPSTNVLKISKSGNTFNIFCNDHYVGRFSDTDFLSGDIAILVPPKAKITVDDVLVTDQPENPPASTCYADSFLTTASDAWSNPSEGEATFGGGQLVLNNTSNKYSSAIFVDAISNTASIKAVVSHKSGVGAYGVAFVEVDTTAVIPFAFAVDSARRLYVVNPDSSTISSLSGIGIFGGLGADTIEVLRFATKCVFKVNGIAQDTAAIPSDFRIDGAGLYAGTNTALACSPFVAGGDSTGARCLPAAVFSPSLARVEPVRPVFGKGSVVYDMLGRKIGVFDRVSFERSNLVNGLYVVLPAVQKVGSARAFPVMKVKN
jgi:hypothetical protein